MLTETDATALSKKKTFSFGIRPQIRIYPLLRYRNVERVNMAADPLSLQISVSRLE
jgi:hypothetical protein